MQKPQTVEVEIDQSQVEVTPECRRVSFAAGEYCVTACIASDGRITLKNDWADDMFHFRNMPAENLAKVAALFQAAADFADQNKS